MIDRFRSIMQRKPDPTACKTCLDQIDDYIAAQLAGADYTGLFPEVADHLDACVACAAAYARLYELERLAVLPDPAEIPEPDLSRLLQKSLRSVLARQMQRGRERLQLRLSEVLLTLLVPSPASAATRSAGRDHRLRYRLSRKQASEVDLPFRFQVYEDGERPGLGLVEVTVEPPGQSWPDLGGRTVFLSYEGERRRETTDAWGVAVFRDVPLAQLGAATVATTATTADLG